MCWRNLWQLVFLEASILSSCFFLTEVQGGTINFTVEMFPEFPVEGQEVYLTPSNMWKDLVNCHWFRDRYLPGRLIFSYYFRPTNRSINGPAFTGRESTGLDCHLRINKLRPEDAGEYIMRVKHPHNYGQGSRRISITEKLPNPLLQSSPPNGIVAENSNNILICHTSNHPDVKISWSKDGKPLPPTMGELSKQNRTLTLSHVAKNNTGTYRCVAKNVISHPESNPVQILVTYGPVIKLTPEGTTYKKLRSELVVECVADSVPEAKLEWFFKGIKQKETGSIFKVQLRKRNDAGSYTCKGTNPFTNHTDEKTGYVILEKGHLSPGAIAGIVIGCVAGVALIAGLLYFLSKNIFRLERTENIQ